MLQKSDPILSIDEEIFELLSLKKSSYPKGVYFALEVLLGRGCWFSCLTTLESNEAGTVSEWTATNNF